ncbi:MAG: ABC transporter substrate-binding protein [Christensenellales bacterium]|jgi:NitT/TauT family transport system substrate-binding protein
MKHFKKFGALLLLLCFCLSLFACGGGQMQEVRVNEVTRSVFYAPQYAAIELGYFQDEGMKVSLENGGGADKSMTAVLSGQADVGFMGPESAVYVYNEGKEDHAVVFAQLTKRDGSFLVGRSDEDFAWENLRGKTVIGGRKGGMPEMTLEYVLKENGLMPGKDVEVLTNIQFNLMGGAFEGGTGDYVTLFEPTASLFQQEGKGYVLTSIGLDSGEIPYTAYMAKKSYIQQNPETIQGFTNAIYKGQLWVMSHSDKEVAEKIMPYFPETDLDLLAAAVKSYRDADCWMQVPVMKEESLDKLQEVMTMAGELDKTAPFAEIVDNSFAQKAVETIQ